MASEPIPLREELCAALKRGDPLEVAALIAKGGDVSGGGRSFHPILVALHGRDISRDPRLLELLSLLIEHGVRLNAVSEYQESALRVLSYAGRFDGVRLLLDAGADAGQLAWTPLMHAVALGTLEDVERELERGAALEDRDWWERTAWLIALATGDLRKAQFLFDRGANGDARGRCQKPALFYAIDGHRPEVVRWLLDIGADVDQVDQSGTTALMHAVEQDDAECLDVLLSAGADVGRDVFGTALHRARGPAVIDRLLAGGADPAELTSEGRRAVAGLPPEPDIALLTASAEDFRRAPTRRFGLSNPEPMNEPFWLAMVRSGVDGWSAGEKFDAARTLPRDPIWCAKRFGQSITRLPDGRVVLVAGEHEDFYDPDFCIYNDVIVCEPKGSIAIFGYPDDLFPPTDFHTATLFGDAIYLVGSLGYDGRRLYGETPVFRLDVQTFRIERLRPTGDAPGWIYGHRADLRGADEIRVTKGAIVTPGKEQELHEANAAAFVLDLDRLHWYRE